jgi:hypothetical protein
MSDGRRGRGGRDIIGGEREGRGGREITEGERVC